MARLFTQHTHTLFTTEDEEARDFDASWQVGVDRNTILYSLLVTGSYSDCSILCGDVQSEVHRSVLAPQSPFFRGALEKAFKKANRTGVVDLQSEDPAIVQQLIPLMYGVPFDYRTRDPIMVADLYSISHRLEVTNIKNVIEAQLRRGLAYQHHNFQYFEEDLAALVEIAYNELPKDNPMRPIVVRECLAYVHCMSIEDVKTELAEAFEKSSTFAVDVLVGLQNQGAWNWA